MSDKPRVVDVSFHVISKDKKVMLQKSDLSFDKNPGYITMRIHDVDRIHTITMAFEDYQKATTKIGDHVIGTMYSEKEK